MKFTKALAVATTAGLIVSGGAVSASAYAPDLGGAKISGVANTSKSTTKVVTLRVNTPDVSGARTTITAVSSGKVVGSSWTKLQSKAVKISFSKAGKKTVTYNLVQTAPGKKTAKKSISHTIYVGKPTSITGVKSVRANSKKVTVSGKTVANGKVQFSFKSGSRTKVVYATANSKGVFTKNFGTLKKGGTVKISYVNGSTYYGTNTVTHKSK